MEKYTNLTTLLIVKNLQFDIELPYCIENKKVTTEANIIYLVPKSSDLKSKYDYHSDLIFNAVKNVYNDVKYVEQTPRAFSQELKEMYEIWNNSRVVKETTVTFYCSNNRAKLKLPLKIFVNEYDQTNSKLILIKDLSTEVDINKFDRDIFSNFIFI